MKDYCLIAVKANKILQVEVITKSTLLFQNVILLELSSKYFSENKNHSLVNTENISCFSRMGEDEDSMQCDNKNCKIIWFHQKCVRTKQIPKEIGIVLNVKNLIKVGKNTRYLMSPFYTNIPFLYSQKISESSCSACFQRVLVEIKHWLKIG